MSSGNGSECNICVRVEFLNFEFLNLFFIFLSLFLPRKKFHVTSTDGPGANLQRRNPPNPPGLEILDFRIGCSGIVFYYYFLLFALFHFVVGTQACENGEVLFCVYVSIFEASEIGETLVENKDNESALFQADVVENFFQVSFFVSVHSWLVVKERIFCLCFVLFSCYVMK